MSTLAQTPSLHAIRCIGHGVLIELLRKKDIYVLAILILVFCIGAFAANFVGIDNPATGTFLLNLGMTLAYIFTHLLTLMLAGRQIPTEIENRTIYPLLARPISRGHLLTGKWLACTLSGYTAYLLFTLLIWTTTPKLEDYTHALFAQLMLVQLLSIGLTASLAILLSLILPKPLTALLMGISIFSGHIILRLITTLSEQTAIHTLVKWTILYLPDFSKFQLTTRYTDGIEALSTPLFLGVILYGSTYILGSLYLAHTLFKKRPL